MTTPNEKKFKTVSIRLPAHSYIPEGDDELLVIASSGAVELRNELRQIDGGRISGLLPVGSARVSCINNAEIIRPVVHLRSEYETSRGYVARDELTDHIPGLMKDLTDAEFHAIYKMIWQLSSDTLLNKIRESREAKE